MCKDCRDGYAAQEWRDESRRIDGGVAVLCKRHSLAAFADAERWGLCDCYERLDDGWKCMRCRKQTLRTLHNRAVPWRNELYFTHVSNVNGRRVYVDFWKARKNPACPVPGCGGRPWMSLMAEEVMEMCLGCCAVQPCLDLPPPN